MRIEESRWIEAFLAKTEGVSPVIELGSSTFEFRTIAKPHIDAHIHAPLRARGDTVVCTDLKAGNGIDISGDIYAPAVLAQLKAVGARTVLCCNIFEHIVDRAGFAAICDQILSPGGVMIVTVPRSYPYHLDPIDTLYRPAPEEIAELFPRYEILDAAVIKSTTHWPDAGGPLGILRDIAKSVTLRGGKEAAKARMHRLTWLFRPYTISAVALRKPAKAPSAAASA
jgi:hypothetical protein